MNHINTYKIFESNTLKKKIESIRDCFREVEDNGINVCISSDKINKNVNIYVSMYKVAEKDRYSTDDQFSIDLITDTIGFFNSYCTELGLTLDGVNYTFYDKEESESSGRYSHNVDDMIDHILGVAIGDKDIFDIILSYRQI